MGLLIAYLLGILSAAIKQPKAKPSIAQSVQENAALTGTSVSTINRPTALNKEQRAETNKHKQTATILATTTAKHHASNPGLRASWTKPESPIAVATLFAAIAVAVIYFFQLKVMEKQYTLSQKSLELTRETIEGTQAAIIEGHVDYAGNDDRFKVILRNRGNMAAREVSGTFTAVLETFSGQLIGPPEMVTLQAGQISTPSGLLGIKESIFSVPGFTLADLANLKTTVVIKGEFGYNNGFEHAVTEKICFEAIPDRSPGRTI